MEIDKTEEQILLLHLSEVHHVQGHRVRTNLHLHLSLPLVPLLLPDAPALARGLHQHPPQAGNLTQKISARSRSVIRADFAPVPPLCYVSLKKLQAEQTSRARYLQEVRAAGSNKKWMWWQ